MEGVYSTQPPVSPPRDDGGGWCTQAPFDGAAETEEAPPRVAFVLRPVSAAAAASEEVELVAPSTVMVGRPPPADVLFDDDERTEDTGLRPFVSARHAYLCVVAREHEDDKKDKFYITPLFRSDGRTAAGVWVDGRELEAGVATRVRAGARVVFGSRCDEKSRVYDKFTFMVVHVDDTNLDAPLKTGRGRETTTETTTKTTKNQKKREKRRASMAALETEMSQLKAENARLKDAARLGKKHRTHETRMKTKKRRRDDDDDDDDDDDTPICWDFNNGRCNRVACRYRHVTDGGRRPSGAHAKRRASAAGLRRAG